jgi:sodium-dependent dicarboxylate transporter 2/3/5
MMVLWPLLGVLSFAEAVRGFGTTTIWLMIGIMLVAAAFNTTGLDQRIALRLLDAARGRTRSTVLWTIVTLLVLTFLIPTGVGRSGVMLPIAQGMVRAARLERGSNVGRAIFLAAALVSLQSGGALMTGSIATLYSVGVFEQLAGYTWTYLGWFALAAPSVFLISLLACPVLLRLHPPEVDVLEGGREYLRAQIQSLGPVRPPELKVAVLFAAMVLGWATAHLHGLATEQVCLLAMLLMFLPPWPALSFEDGLKRVSWSTVVLFGSSLSLSVALERSRVMDVLVEAVQGAVPRDWPPVVVGLLAMLVVAGLRLGFPNTIAMIATILPAAIVAAASLGLNPVWLGMLAVHASQVLILPVQSPTSMTLYSAGYFSVPQMLRAGLVMAAILVGVTLLFAQLYWPLLGVAPR